MGKYQVHRSDGNAARIIATLEAYGAQWTALGRPLDGVVGYQGLSVLCEIKTARGKLRASQRAFLEGYRGWAVVLRTEDEAVELLKAMATKAVGRTT